MNVVDFGAFVDIGLKDSGLVHISQLANRYIKSPHDVVSVGDVVTAWVMGVDHERKRVSLTMVKPGTERPRGGHGPEPKPDLGVEAAARGGGGVEKARKGEAAPAVRRVARGQLRPVLSRRGRVHPLREAGPRPGVPRERRGIAPVGSVVVKAKAVPAAVGLAPHGGGPGRYERAQQPPRPTPPARPAKPAPPPPPLSKDALAGSVPLRSFGQLKQLWQARVDEPAEGETPAPTEATAEATQAQAPATPPPAAAEPAAEAPAPTPPETHTGEESAS